MYNPYDIQYFGNNLFGNNRADQLNALNSAEGNNLAQPVQQNAQNKLIGQMARPMPMQDNSGLVNAFKSNVTTGADIQPMQLQHGLIGRTLHQYAGEFLGGNNQPQQPLPTNPPPPDRQSVLNNHLSYLNQNTSY